MSSTRHFFSGEKRPANEVVRTTVAAPFHARFFAPLLPPATGRVPRVVRRPEVRTAAGYREARARAGANCRDRRRCSWPAAAAPSVPASCYVSIVWWRCPERRRARRCLWQGSEQCGGRGDQLLETSRGGLDQGSEFRFAKQRDCNILI